MIHRTIELNDSDDFTVANGTYELASGVVAVRQELDTAFKHGPGDYAAGIRTGAGIAAAVEANRGDLEYDVRNRARAAAIRNARVDPDTIRLDVEYDGDTAKARITFTTTEGEEAEIDV